MKKEQKDFNSSVPRQEQSEAPSSAVGYLGEGLGGQTRTRGSTGASGSGRLLAAASLTPWLLIKGKLKVLLALRTGCGSGGETGVPSRPAEEGWDANARLSQGTSGRRAGVRAGPLLGFVSAAWGLLREENKVKGQRPPITKRKSRSKAEPPAGLRKGAVSELLSHQPRRT